MKKHNKQLKLNINIPNNIEYGNNYPNYSNQTKNNIIPSIYTIKTKNSLNGIDSIPPLFNKSALSNTNKSISEKKSRPQSINKLSYDNLSKSNLNSVKVKKTHLSNESSMYQNKTFYNSNSSSQQPIVNYSTYNNFNSNKSKFMIDTSSNKLSNSSNSLGSVLHSAANSNVSLTSSDSNKVSPSIKKKASKQYRLTPISKYRPSPIMSEKEKYNNDFSNQYNTNVPHTTKNQPLSIMSLFASTLPLDIKYLHMSFPHYDVSKYSSKSLGVIRAYSANTHQGTIRDYNEDRVSIILNIVRPTSYHGSFWPKCSFFGVYDGHGGSGCSEFLRDQLHHFVVKDNHFPVNPKEALIRGFEAAEQEFLSKYALNKSGNDVIDRSGSCAIVALVVDDIVYIANLGDSRAVLSKNGGKDVVVLSRDHKPEDESESKRIIEAGGKVYQ